MPEYITLRRWSLNEGADEAALIAVVRDAIVPAYKTQPGCLRLQLLRVTGTPSYLAMTHWESKGAFDAWAGDDGRAWRDAYRLTLERWLELMTFEEEYAADLVVAG